MCVQVLFSAQRRAESYDGHPAGRLQRHNGTKEQKTNMKLMSKAFCFCLWSCIGVISEEGPWSYIKPPQSPLGSGMKRARAAHFGEMEGVVVAGFVPRDAGVRSQSRPVAR